MQVHFQKMLGAGNRILIIDQRRADAAGPVTDVVQALRQHDQTADFDQLMWLIPATEPSCTAAYRVFNNDGSEVEQCGNGVRCVAVMLAADGPPAGGELLLESPAGIVTARIESPHRASVSMGRPLFDDSLRSLEVGGRKIEVHLVSMGNPHCVLDVPSVSTADVASLGPAIESHERFPDRINVGFRHIVDRSLIDLRVFERGAGETAACGTGACAAVASGQRLGLLDDEVTARLPGGQLVVSWRGGDHPMWLSGDTETISEGRIDV